MVWQTEALGLSNEQAAKNLGVDKSTVSRIRHKFLTSGSIEKKAYPKAKAYRKLTSVAQLLVLHLVLQKPGVLLSEVQNELTSVLAVDVDVSTICRFLQASGFTRQKLRYVALQRDEFLRQKFMLDMTC
jgi:transposase